jgi:hypothetical protein
MVMKTKPFIRNDRLSFRYTGTGAYSAANQNWQHLISKVDVFPGDFVDHEGGCYGWKAKIKQRKQATTWLNGVDHFSFGATPSGTYTKHIDDGQKSKLLVEYQGTTAAYLDIPSDTLSAVSLTQANNLALTEFMQKARNAQRALQGLVAAGELGETIRMILRPADALRKSTDRLTQRWSIESARIRRGFGKSKNAKKIEVNKRLREAASGTWLEWSFGAQPLVDDIQGGAKALARVVTYHPPSVFVTGKAKVIHARTVYEHPIAGADMNMNAYIEITTESSVKYRGLVWTQVNLGSHNAAQFGVSLSDIVPALWELIPYSFLVDYFANIGDIIDAASFPTASVAWCDYGSEKLRRSRLLRIDVAPRILTSPKEVLDRFSLKLESGAVAGVRHVSRARYTGDFIPSLSFRIPAVFRRLDDGDHVTSKKWLNMAALIAASVGKPNRAPGARPPHTLRIYNRYNY